MNLSCLTSDNEDQNVSSFFNDSCRSVQGCCEYRSKYKEVYKELSHIRIELRNLKSHDQTLKNSLEGTQEQVQLLQQILNTKKQMITKLNFQLTASNEQINRLEDQLNQTRKGKKEADNKLNDAIKFTQDIQNNLNKERQVNQNITAQKERIQKDFSSVQQEYQQFKVKTERQNRHIIHEKTQIVNRVNLLFENNKKEGLSIHKLSTKQVNNSQQGLSKTELSQSIDSWTKIPAKIQQFIRKNKEHEEVLISKDTIIAQLTNSNMHLQSQISSSLELFQQQMQQLSNLKKQAKEKEVQQLQTITRQNQSEKHHCLLYLLQSVVNILRNTFYNDSPNLLDKILALAKNSNNKFEVQVILSQIRNYAEQSYNQMLRQRINTKQFEKLTKNCKQFQENYEVLHLKFRTLERSYREAIQDNNRLIKFNHLTQYRINRNMSPQSSLQTSKYEKSPLVLTKQNGINSYNKQNISFKHNS